MLLQPALSYGDSVGVVWVARRSVTHFDAGGRPKYIGRSWRATVRTGNIAVLMCHVLLKRAEVDLDLARKVLTRQSALRQTSATSEARLEEAERDVLVREAELVAAQERLALARVTAPIAGQVLLVHARAGERIGTSGLLELGQTQHMYVVAEVYETDIGLVKEGQAATISSPALSEALNGNVERIGSIIGKNDILDLDPVARTDSRVVEVFIRLDDSEAVASLTYLQVDVEIHD